MKILGFSSIRSDYDIMSPLYERLRDDKDIDFRLVISGAHLSKEFGHSIDQIQKDGFNILLKTQTLLSSDSRSSRLKSAGILLINSLETIAEFNPDLIIFAGDREDVVIYSMIGGYLGIPTAHFFAGDHSKDGYIDNPIRHAASKLATTHFVTLNEHKDRLISMGEEADRIFVIGNLSLDRFLNFKPIAKNELLEYFGLDDFNEFALLIFHPVTQEVPKVDEYFENILLSLKDANIKAFVSYPNIDYGNSKLFKMIDKYTNDKNFYFYKNLDRDKFISIYKNAKFIIGNSSSGVCGEAASINIPTINVGIRQVGRQSDKSVIYTDTSKNSIQNAIKKATSFDFLESIKGLKSIYGDGNSAQKAYGIIKTFDFKSKLLKTFDPLKDSK
ncbi:UDP-N-acetylglucosamine 2-epimerase [Campylobacter mucosalis]|uniref:GDP-2,4-diacetamido-2,4, 6-trideoxy-alpha-D-glucopyranose hydrolase / 2-epimerase n=1 Tax=Campylobacter mucosalis CCUG 21559 TaxID=1032067 RepID=A0A6G5QEA2_9BACT|nr:UDP-N-acetylglucosamine 2-epimerase [Campylobacter mucosalis]QCD44010.1 GDP-2,4-diacetamido-2,4,6-trideoxy-alpha-D-glucopyranose hydrolase / 2-epimerase [Campylobacter mucosalis CCUG 21559]